MNAKDRFYITLSKFFPASYKEKFKQLMNYAGVDSNLNVYLGAVTLFALLAAAIIALAYLLFVDSYRYLAFAAAAIGFVLVEYLYYLTFLFKANGRAKLTEQILPEFLQMVSSNIKAGMTPFKALKTATKFDFGPLSREIERVTKESAGVGNFENSLMKMSKRIKSNVLERTLQLFVTSLHSGSGLSKLLEELSSDLTESLSLRKELLSSTKSYTMFIMFTVLIGTPLLLAVSINFVDTLTGLSFFQNVGSQVDLAGFGDIELEITSDFLFKVAIAMLFFTTLLASMFLGVIRDGNRSSGLKFAIPMYLLSLAIFLIAKFSFKGFV